jgi:transcriptional regulator with XRE-family HTH domain
MKGRKNMEEMLVAYKGEFTIEERKNMTAQALKELRKGKKLSQKEVAAYINIPATTYNTYESGRTEPPIEILVRLSHLYELPIDVIVQRDRTYCTADDVGKQMAVFKEQLDELDKQIAERGTDAPGVPEFMAALNKLADAMTAYSQTEAAQKALDNAAKD